MPAKCQNNRLFFQVLRTKRYAYHGNKKSGSMNYLYVFTIVDIVCKWTKHSIFLKLITNQTWTTIMLKMLKPSSRLTSFWPVAFYESPTQSLPLWFPYILHDLDQHQCRPKMIRTYSLVVGSWGRIRCHIYHWSITIL